jgi:hypothetical protein
MLKSQTLAISIGRPPSEVAAFIADGENFTRWLTFVTATRRSGDAWILETGQGEMVLRMAPQNPFGIVDNFVKLPDGTEVVNPVRVVANGDGSEVLFTLFRQPGWSEGQFAEDAATVEADLQALKRALES